MDATDSTKGTAPRAAQASDHAVIVPYRDGPLLVRGTFELRSPDGTVIDPGRETVALCRCGRSAIKPFCDGSHTIVGFRAPAGDSRRRAATAAADAERSESDRARSGSTERRRDAPE